MHLADDEHTQKRNKKQAPLIFFARTNPKCSSTSSSRQMSASSAMRRNQSPSEVFLALDLSSCTWQSGRGEHGLNYYILLQKKAACAPTFTSRWAMLAHLWKFLMCIISIGNPGIKVMGRNYDTLRSNNSVKHAWKAFFSAKHLADVSIQLLRWQHQFNNCVCVVQIAGVVHKQTRPGRAEPRVPNTSPSSSLSLQHHMQN